MKLSGSNMKFSVRHADANPPSEEGFRQYAKYRDLGLVEATAGAVQAHVIRPTYPPTEKTRSRHYHAYELSMVYLLNGWMKLEIEGQEVVLKPGSCMMMPGGTRHAVLDFSEDCDVLEINLPAQFDTVPA